MQIKCKIANLNISVQCDFDILKNGFGNLFEEDFSDSDVNITVSLNEIIRSGKVVYSDDKTDVMVSDDNIFSVITKDRQYKYDYIMSTQNGNDYTCVVNKDSVEITRDLYFLWSYIGLPHMMLENNRVFFHGSFIVADGKAIVFSGKSGIGKSTQAQLWEKYADAQIVNGDKTILFVENGKLFASSSPIAGSSGICENKTAEVAAIVMLDQANSNYITELGKAEKVGLLVSNSACDSWRKSDFNKLITLCASFYDKTKMFRYNCLPDKSAVDFLKAVIG